VGVDLARASGADAGSVGMGALPRRFRSLVDDPSDSDFRRDLVAVTKEYALGGGRAAD